MAWRLTNAAESDLTGIALSGAELFGLSHSRRYVLKLVEVFDPLAAHPEMAPQRQASRQAVRLMPHEAHHILYLISDGEVIILRVLHHLQDWFDLV